MYRWNFADIYNLLNKNINNYKILSSINAYSDTIINKNNISKMIEELKTIKNLSNEKIIDDFIDFISNSDSDILFIWD